MSNSTWRTIDKIPLAGRFGRLRHLATALLNLAPDKPAVFREIARVLKPGGRLAVSDIALKGELPEAIASSLAAYVGCIAGAIRMDNLPRADCSRRDLRTLKSWTAEPI